jgi:hypothetical protein
MNMKNVQDMMRTKQSKMLHEYNEFAKQEGTPVQRVNNNVQPRQPVNIENAVKRMIKK